MRRLGFGFGFGLTSRSRSAAIVRVVPLGLLLLISAAFSSSALAQQSTTVQLGPGREEQDVNGTATISDAGGGRTRVVVRVNPANPNMPGHIHSDACPGAGPVVYPLTNVVNGQSTTDIDAPIADVLAKGKSINLHKSPDQAGIYVSCGEFQAAAAGAGGPVAQTPGALPRTGDVGSLAPVVGAVGAGLLTAGYALRRRFFRA